MYHSRCFISKNIIWMLSFIFPSSYIWVVRFWMGQTPKRMWCIGAQPPCFWLDSFLNPSRVLLTVLAQKKIYQENSDWVTVGLAHGDWNSRIMFPSSQVWSIFLKLVEPKMYFTFSITSCLPCTCTWTWLVIWEAMTVITRSRLRSESSWSGRASEYLALMIPIDY